MSDPLSEFIRSRIGIGGTPLPTASSTEQTARDLVARGKEAVAGVGAGLDAMFPGLKGLAHGITTGDWQPYKESFQQGALSKIGPIIKTDPATGKPLRDPATGKLVLNEEAMKAMADLTLGFVNPVGSGARATKGAIEAFSKEAAALDDAARIATRAKETFPGLSDEQAGQLGARYAATKDAAAIAGDLETMAAQATRSASGQGAPDAAGGRPQSPTLPEQVPARPQVPQYPRAGARPNGAVSSDPLYRTLFEDSTSLGQTLRKALTSTLEYVQDSSRRVFDLQRIPGTAVDDASNIFQAQTLYPGRVQAAAEDATKVGREVFDSLSKTAKQTGRSFEELRTDLNDYLIAKHAPERNAQLGDKAAGMTDEEAAAIRARVETSKEANEIGAAARTIMDLHKRSLAMLEQSGVISKETAETLTSKYPNHVPLYRIMENEDDLAGILTGKGYDVRSTGIKRAKGSEREVSDIMGNVLYNYEQAVLRSEKNLVDRTVLDFVRKNPQFDDLFKIVNPKAVGKDFGGKPILERTDDPTVLQLFEDGKRVWIKVADERLAIALRGVGREKLGPFLNTIASFTRFYSGLQTRFNPEFFAPNKLRDLQEAMIFAASQGKMGGKGALEVARRDPESIAAVSDWLRGKDSVGARTYDEMRREGGTTGGMGLSTRKQAQMDVEELAKTATSKPRQAARSLIEGVDNLNQVFEDSTRLSIYRAALNNGMTKKQAAALAKEGTINFNRMGTGGPVINGLWMFSNASIQGSAKMIRSMANPKVAAAVITSVSAAVAAVSAYNDKMDPKWRDKVTKWDRMNALNVMLPGSDGTNRYVSIPVSWGLKPIKVFADYATDALYGEAVDPKTAAMDLFTSIAEGYNPVGGTDLASAITPTVLDAPIEVARNRAWSGSKIRPDFDKNAPPSIQYFDSLREKQSGQIAIGATEQLARMGIEISPADLNYAYEQYMGGAGRAATKTANTLWGTVTPDKDLPPVSEFPLISRFYRERPEEEVTASGKASEDLNALETEASRARFYRNQKADDFIKSLDGLSAAEKTAKIRELAATNKDLAKKVLEDMKDQAAGLTGPEKKLKNATVDSRARYIVGQLATMSKEEKAAYLKDLAAKKIITKAVLERIAALQASE